MRVVGKKEGYDKGGKNNGIGNEGGGRATKRTRARAGREIAMAMMMADDKEGNGKGCKSNGNGNEGGR